MTPPTSIVDSDDSSKTTTLQDVKATGQVLQRKPLIPSGALDHFKRFELTPHIGTEFEAGVQLSSLLNAPNSDDLIRDLAILISRRNVVFFRAQDLSIDDQKLLVQRLGELSGKPATSKLHVHPIISFSPRGEDISVIHSKEIRDYSKTGREPPFGNETWHTDIIFENVPSDYSILKLHTPPASGSGGDTLWSSAYELYDRLTPAFRKFLEGLTATHDGNRFKEVAATRGVQIRTVRGSPENTGEDLRAVHPVVRTHPVTGWKGVYVARGFTTHINELSRDESDAILQFLFTLNERSHDLHVRFRWSKDDVAIWDNRCSHHTATYDFGTQLRVGDRAVSLGERPYFDPASRSRREDLGIPSFFQERYGFDYQPNS
ncbi:putative TfdA family taurine dioxygenase [Zopfochytrium polystomum]|nr:putative TfdA family taurine dioxygenase [Zopfochytrium polystomum]